MELALIIIRNVTIAIVGLYAIFLVIDIIFVVSFRSIMGRHDRDLCLILTNKKDNLDKLSALINKHNIKVDKKQADALANFDLNTIEHQDGEEAKKARELLTSISEYFMYVARDNDKVTNDAEFELISGNVDESEKLYRQHVVLYNADVLGYNFWISFFPTRFIYKILKFKAKDIIN